MTALIPYQQPSPSIVLMPAAAPPPPSQADSDAELIALWLRGKVSRHTRRSYLADLKRFHAFTGGLPLRSIRLKDLQAYGDQLAASGLRESSQSRGIGTIKSLLSFASKLGYVQFNVGAAWQGPRVRNTLAERILDETAVHRMLALASGRDAVLLRLLYSAGLRVSELCGLRWKDVQANRDTGQVVVFGKGGKTRSVLLSTATWQVLIAMRPAEASPETPVFRSRKGGAALSVSQVWRIVRTAARRAGISANVSPHWLRHCHASHALERGANIALVSQTLGHSSIAVTSVYTHAPPDDSSSRYLGV